MVPSHWPARTGLAPRLGIALYLVAPTLGFATQATLPAAPTPLPLPVSTTPAPDYRELFRRAMAARAEGDAGSYLAHLEEAARLHPEPRLLGFRLAGALALTGSAARAFDQLESLAAVGAWRDLAAEPDFATLHDSPRWSPLLVRFAALREPLARSRVAFRLAERDLLVEGIAHDAASGGFFLGSVHRGRILRRKADGTVATFADLHGLAPLGLAVDATSKRLWAVVADLPQTAERDPARKDATFLLAFDLASGREVARIAPPAGGGQALNDLVVAGDGRVYASDSRSGAVWTLAPGGRQLEVVIGPGHLGSAGGLALFDGERRLLVADWSRGLVVIDLADRSWKRVATPADFLPVGLDGLLAKGAAFVAIQNGLEPARVVRFWLDSSAGAVERVETLERAHPEYAEPTLGVLVGSNLFYVANSQWESFGEDGRANPTAELTAPVILRLPLP